MSASTPASPTSPPSKTTSAPPQVVSPDPETEDTMAEDAEKAILLSRFPTFEGKEGEERDWHNLARVIFEREIRDWPVDQIRLFKDTVPKMTHGAGSTTRNRYHHKLIVAFKSKPTWAVACCIKIMFGGWEALEPSAVGTHMKRAFPGHDCSSWACPTMPAPDKQDDSESEALSVKRTRKRGPAPKGGAQSSTGPKAATNKRRKTTKNTATEERTVTPEARSKTTTSLAPTAGIEQDEAAISNLRNAYGYVDASYAIKPEPFQTPQPFTLPNFAPPTEAEREANIRHQISPFLSTPGTPNSTVGQRASTVSRDVNNPAGESQTPRTASVPLLFDKDVDVKGAPKPKGVLPSVEASQTAIDAAQRRQALFIRIRDEVQRLQAVSRLQLLTRDSYVSHVARLQDERIAELQGHIDELEGLD